MVNAEYKQFSRFCLVGVVNTAVNYVSYIVLLSFLSHYYLFAGAIGFLRIPVSWRCQFTH